MKDKLKIKNITEIALKYHSLIDFDCLRFSYIFQYMKTENNILT